MRKILTVIVGLTLALTMVFGLLPACQNGETTPNVSGTPTAVGEVYKWRYQSTANAGTATYWTEEEFVDVMAKASGGRIILDLQPQGAIVGTNEIFDAVATGAIEVGTGVDCYWQGKDQRFNLEGVIAAHFTWSQLATYMYADAAGGQKETDELFEKFGIKRIQKTISETEVAAVANKKIVEAADYKGLTFRGAGYSTLTIQEPEFGASGVNMPTGDIYTGLQTKVIDACEMSNAFSNFAMGYQEVTKYWMFPGIHQLTQNGALLVNLDLWNKLPEDLQWIIRTVATYSMIRTWAFNHFESAKIIPELQQKYGIEIVRLSPEAQKTWKTVAWRLADNEAAKNPDFKTMWDNHKALMATLAPYEELQTVNYAK